MKLRFKGPLFQSLKQFPFVIVDAGARGGLKKEWLNLRPFLKCIGFEPDPEEFERLQRASGDEQISYRPCGLWDSRQQLTLHVTKKVGLSSVYFPNEKFLKRFGPLNVEGYHVEQKISMTASRLDEVLSPSEAKLIDFIKVDVEGAALEILRGAEAVLKEGVVVGLRVEAEFNPKYSGQHLFSEVDQWLRPFDYQLFDLRPCRWKRKVGLKTGGISGQLVHGDFIYFLEIDSFFRKIQKLSLEERVTKTTKFLVFLCLYGIYDMAFELVEEASRREIFSKTEAESLKAELRKTEGLLVRLPKIQARGVLGEFIYHLWMLAAGIWLERRGYWKPQVELQVT